MSGIECVGLVAADPENGFKIGQKVVALVGSAFVLGIPDFPLREIPFQTLVDRVAAGIYRANLPRYSDSMRSNPPTA